jgi:hypothetical protein
MHPTRLWGKFTVEEKTGDRAAGSGSGFFIQNLPLDKKYALSEKQVVYQEDGRLERIQNAASARK